MQDSLYKMEDVVKPANDMVMAGIRERIKKLRSKLRAYEKKRKKC